MLHTKKVFFIFLNLISFDNTKLQSMQIPEMPNLIHYAIPFFALTVIIEVIATVRLQMKDYEYKDAGTSIAMGLGNVPFNLQSS